MKKNTLLIICFLLSSTLLYSQKTIAIITDMDGNRFECSKIYLSGGYYKYDAVWGYVGDNKIKFEFRKLKSMQLIRKENINDYYFKMTAKNDNTTTAKFNGNDKFVGTTDFGAASVYTKNLKSIHFFYPDY